MKPMPNVFASACHRVLLLTAVTIAVGPSSLAAQRPNVVLIMTDNHGAWTLGCYGNQDIRTPNIDALAGDGTLFTRAFSSNPVCSPTRATFLTGLLPSQHGVHCFLRGGRLQIGLDARCTLDELTSLPEVLRDSGYSCGLVGKWHLGDNLHPQEGLNDYWITMPHGGTSTFYDAQIIEDGKLRQESQYLTDFWTDHAVKFIDQQAGGEKPFFLFLSYNGPYSLGRLLLKDGQNRHAAYYADKELPSFPREKTHPWQFSNRDYQNNPVSIRRVATEVSGVDDGVGTVMQTLRKHGLDENTIVIFVADQGWVGGQGGFFGMGDHTQPLTARDGMMRIPMIWRHPKNIAAGKRSDRLVTNYDLMPTLLSYLNLGERMPQQPRSPGVDFSGTLKDAKSAAAAETADRDVFYEFENLRSIRTVRWKYIHRHPNGPHELYDLSRDSEEFNNLARDTQHAALRDELKGRLEAFYAQHALPKYDMWRGGGSQTFIFDGIDEELAQADAAPSPPLTDGFTPAQINVPEDFTVELAAGPPLVTHPTLACFDDRGRLFVCNNAGVNMSAEELEKNLPNSIRMLEDRDGDGRFDRSTVFADRMTYPMGGAWHDGALYVASPPNIWRLEDTDGDGTADRREVLVSQFGYTGNAASIHGCFNGPDGRLYWCDGYHGHEFRDEDGEIRSKREGSYIFSCWPDGSDVQIHCGGGMDNPVEVDFTDEGEMLGTVNIMYSRPRIDCLVHWLYGGAYPHRERVLEELKITGDVLGPVHKFGHVAVSGVMRYRSGVLDHRWRDNQFVTFFNVGRVARVELARDGSTFRATQREFLSGTSRDFHPTDVLEDADGSLLVVDTGGWFYRGCPTSQIAKPDVLGGIYRIRRSGVTMQVDPWGKRIEWAKLPERELASLLNDTRFKVREMAIDECIKRGAAMVPTLQQSVARRDIRERRNALWALTAIARKVPAAKEAVRSALNDGSSSIRLTAARSIATNPNPAAIDRLKEILHSDEPPVRREAAKALGRIGDSKAVNALLRAFSCNGQIDRTENHAVIFALIEINAPEETAKGLIAKKPEVQRGALIALDQMDAAGVTAAQVAPLLDADNAALRKTALEVLQRRAGGKDKAQSAQWQTVAVNQLQRWLQDEDAAKDRANVIHGLIKTFAKHQDVQQLIGRSLNDAAAAAKTRDLLFSAIADCQGIPLHGSWEQPLRRQLQFSDPRQVQAALSAVAAIDTDRFDEELKKISADQNRPALLRVAAVKTLSGSSSKLSDDAFGILVELTTRGAPAESSQAAQMLGAASLTAEQLLALSKHLSTAGPLALRDLIRPYQRSSNSSVATAFLDSMQRARSLLSLPTNEVSDVVKRYPQDLLPRANALLERLRQQEQAQLARVDELLSLLKQGDPERGRQAFFAEKSKCATCHRVGDKGGKIGPDLTTIGANRTDRDLLESIVFPSSSIVRQYEPYTLVTDAGRVYNGLITRETADTVYIQQPVGEPIAVPRAEIDELSPSTVSVMPKGLEQALTPEQLADIVAWLRSLKSPGQVARVQGPESSE